MLFFASQFHVRVQYLLRSWIDFDLSAHWVLNPLLAMLITISKAAPIFNLVFQVEQDVSRLKPWLSICLIDTSVTIIAELIWISQISLSLSPYSLPRVFNGSDRLISAP